jgi:GR25 family glycosyltransferase involved in LPS biosynthesis
MHHNIAMSADLAKFTFASFIINLDSRADRLLSAQNEFKKLAMPFARIAAVTPDTLSTKVVFVKPAVAACWASHLKVYEKIVSENIDIALICEDDIVFKSVDIDSLVGAMQEDQIDVLQIGFLYGTLGRKIDLFGRNLLHIFLLLIKKFSFLPLGKKAKNSPQVKEVSLTHPWLVPGDFRFGTHCYLISRGAAEKILSIGGIQFLAADDFLVALAKMRFFNIQRMFQSKCGQTNSPSSIL